MPEQPEHTREQRIPLVRVGQLPKPAMKNRNQVTTGKQSSVNSRLLSPIGGLRKSVDPSRKKGPASVISHGQKSQKSHDSKYSAGYKGVPRVQLQVPLKRRNPSGVYSHEQKKLPTESMNYRRS
mmetsp:Transcript_35265/g.54005  ORF Transcript_35265/g.54005 Transcript_35265/m.54005 type:complete len:124 (+) Transcript_35265:443-814(+)